VTLRWALVHCALSFVVIILLLVSSIDVNQTKSTLIFIHTMSTLIFIHRLGLSLGPRREVGEDGVTLGLGLGPLSTVSAAAAAAAEYGQTTILLFLVR